MQNFQSFEFEKRVGSMFLYKLGNVIGQSSYNTTFSPESAYVLHTTTIQTLDSQNCVVTSARILTDFKEKIGYVVNMFIYIANVPTQSVDICNDFICDLNTILKPEGINQLYYLEQARQTMPLNTYLKSFTDSDIEHKIVELKNAICQDRLINLQLENPGIFKDLPLYQIDMSMMFNDDYISLNNLDAFGKKRRWLHPFRFSISRDMPYNPTFKLLPTPINLEYEGYFDEEECSGIDYEYYESLMA